MLIKNERNAKFDITRLIADVKECLGYKEREKSQQLTSNCICAFGDKITLLDAGKHTVIDQLVLGFLYLQAIDQPKIKKFRFKENRTYLYVANSK